jgi:hypothetical protein
MSIKLMAAAWELDIPATEKMVLLCLCDHANSSGVCWPGAEGLARRCSFSERTVRKAIQWLKTHGWIAIETRAGKVSTYHIDPGSKFTPAANSAPPRKEVPDTPEAGSDEPSITIIEPSEVKSSDDDALSPDDVIEGWNALAEECGLPVVRKLTETRKRKLRTRLKQFPNIEDWRRALTEIRANRWMHGDNDRGWRADFDFLLQDKSFTKLTEGAYGKAG